MASISSPKPSSEPKVENIANLLSKLSETFSQMTPEDFNMFAIPYDDILKQVEYYFSDANILEDEFLLNLVNKDADGWVDLIIIAGFKKMKKFNVPLYEVVAALEKSSKLSVRREPHPAVKRIDPIPPRDPDYEKKFLIATNLPPEEISKIKDLSCRLKEANICFKSIKCFPPMTNLSKVLKNAVNKHMLPANDKRTYLIEFHDVDSVLSALKDIRVLWPTAYSSPLYRKARPSKVPINKREIPQLAATSSNKNGLKNRSRDTGTSVEDTNDLPPVERPRIRIKAPDPNVPQVLVARHPIIPPSEESVGFVKDWKKLLITNQLPHLPLNQEAMYESAKNVCTAVLTPADKESKAKPCSVLSMICNETNNAAGSTEKPSLTSFDDPAIIDFL